MSLKRLFPLLLLLALSITLMTYQSNKGMIAPFRHLSNPLISLNNIFNSFLDTIKEPFRKISLRDEENRRLKEEINMLLSEQQKYRDTFLENQRLREILSLKEKEKRYVTAARVISKGWDLWSNTIIIDKGKNAGILKNMAVITPQGLIGKISHINDNNAYVLLAADINFSAAVKIQETRRDAILSGSGSGHCILKYIPQGETLKEGSVVVTSGLDDLFPQEIPVGYISAILKKTAGVFQTVEVKPFQDLTKIDEVIVVRR